MLLLYPPQHLDLCSFQRRQESILLMLSWPVRAAVLSQTRPGSPPQQSGPECFLVLEPICPLTRLSQGCCLMRASAAASDSSKVSNSARHSEISVNSCCCLKNPVVGCLTLSVSMRWSFFLFNTNFSCCHNQAVTDMSAGTWARHTGRCQSNHKSCSICHLNSREITSHLSNMARGIEKQPGSDKIESLMNRFNCSPLICWGGGTTIPLKFTGTPWNTSLCDSFSLLSFWMTYRLQQGLRRVRSQRVHCSTLLTHAALLR